jgi:hypothetical protein
METKFVDTSKGRGAEPQDDKKHDHDNHQKLVAVHLNEPPPKHIPAGEYTGRTLKLALGVPVEHKLEQVVHGKFDEVGNDEKIRIKGGEKFVSHCGQGQSS